MISINVGSVPAEVSKRRDGITDCGAPDRPTVRRCGPPHDPDPRHQSWNPLSLDSSAPPPEKLRPVPLPVTSEFLTRTVTFGP
jgi:hypothetical protein